MKILRSTEYPIGHILNPLTPHTGAQPSNAARMLEASKKLEAARERGDRPSIVYWTRVQREITDRSVDKLAKEMPA